MDLKKVTAIIVSISLIAGMTMTAFADGDEEGVLEGRLIPTEETVIGEGGYGYSEEQWTRLMDNVLEYDEIPDLIHNFNSTIVEVWDNLEDTQQKLQNSVIELESQSFKMKNLKERAEDNGEITDQINYATQELILDAVASGLRSSTNSMLVSRSTRASITKVEEQLTQAAQSLMIAYDSMTKQMQTLSAMSDMYAAQYKLLMDERELGMATETEVLEARNNQLSAESTVMSLQSSIISILPTLCSLTGWPADAQPVIAPIPQVDISRIYAMNLEEDTVKAIGNNTTLISQRHSARGDTYDESARRLAWIDEGEQKLTITMKELYDDVYTKLTAFQAAQTGWEAAQRDQQSYQHMYDLGMLSKSDYLATQIAYYSSKASYESADTALLLAIETYNWAVLGLVDVDMD